MIVVLTNSNNIFVAKFKITRFSKMVRKSELPSTKRSQIVLLSQEGYTTRDISRRMTVSQSCVVKTIQRFKEQGNYASKTRSGRPKVTTPRTDTRIGRYSKSHPFASGPEISTNVFPDGDKPSLRTIRRRFDNDIKLPSRKPAKKPKLSPKNIRDRIAFCKKYQLWTAEQWENVMFSDESSFEQFGRRSYTVRRPVGARYNPKYVLPTVKQPPKLMIWGAITAQHRCGLWFMPPNTTINGQVYLTILQEKLRIFMDITNTNCFQHDGAPCHRSKLVSNWLRNEGVEVLGPWPGNSPDLNPIENAWDFMKNCVSKLEPTSIDDLQQKIKLVWTQQIPREYLQKLIHSMPARLEACLRAKGGHTRY